MVSFDGESASKVDDVTALPSRHKMTDMCYYGNVMTTTRWWLCVTILHLQQYSHRLNLFPPPTHSSNPSSHSTGNWRSSHSLASSSDVQNDQGCASNSSYAFNSFKMTNYRLKGHGSNFGNDRNVSFDHQIQTNPAARVSSHQTHKVKIIFPRFLFQTPRHEDMHSYLASRWSWVTRFTLRSPYLERRSPASRWMGDNLVPELVWTFCRREKSLVFAGNWAPVFSFIQNITKSLH